MVGFSTDGILLKRIEYGDHDLIVTFFTTSMGRISVIAKNAKKSVKRFAGALEPFSVMNIECTWPKQKKALPMLNAVDLCQPFCKNQDQYHKKPGMPAIGLSLSILPWKRVKKRRGFMSFSFYVLQALDAGSMDKEVLSLLFQMRFMNLLGLSPDFTCCGTCSTPLDDIAQEANHL